MTSFIRRSALVLFTSSLLVGTAWQSANASDCKGLDQSACSRNSSCNWVDGYARKDGKKVSAHCRTASSKKKAGSSSSSSAGKTKSSASQSKSDTGKSKTRAKSDSSASSSN